MATLTDLDEHEVVWDRYREGPFAGLTLAKARIVNEVFWGYPVRVRSFHDRKEAEKATKYPMAGTPRERQLWRLENPTLRPKVVEGEFGIFLGFRLPGMWGNGFEAVFDVKIATNVFEDGAVSSGTSRMLGLGALAELEIVEPRAWGFCADCSCWRPMGLLRERATRWDWDWIAQEADVDEGLADYYHDLVCRRSCQES